jgi:hypothetical protein
MASLRHCTSRSFLVRRSLGLPLLNFSFDISFAFACRNPIGHFGLFLGIQSPSAYVLKRHFNAPNALTLNHSKSLAWLHAEESIYYFPLIPPHTMKIFELSLFFSSILIIIQ